MPGTAYAANPYHYAGNDPVNALDPLGLRPLTDADLLAQRTAVGVGARYAGTPSTCSVVAPARSPCRPASRSPRVPTPTTG